MWTVTATIKGELRVKQWRLRETAEMLQWLLRVYDIAPPAAINGATVTLNGVDFTQAVKQEIIVMIQEQGGL